MDITYQLCHKLFEYREGQLFWKENRGGGAKAGDLAGNFAIHKESNYPYWSVTINSKGYLLHRVVFLMHKGYLPEYPDEIDHKDRNSLNNRIENLRHVTKSQNSMNKKIRIDNTYGIKGVYWKKENQKWASSISINKKLKHLGYFDNFLNACCARKSAENQHYGEFALRQ